MPKTKKRSKSKSVSKTKKSSKTKRKPEIPNRRYYVVMSDKFMSGWGLAEGKTSKFVIGTNDYQKARELEAKAKKRPEMKYVSIRSTKPYYDKRHYHTSYRNASEIGW